MYVCIAGGVAPSCTMCRERLFCYFGAYIKLPVSVDMEFDFHVSYIVGRSCSFFIGLFLLGCRCSSFSRARPPFLHFGTIELNVKNKMSYSSELRLCTLARHAVPPGKEINKSAKLEHGGHIYIFCFYSFL